MTFIVNDKIYKTKKEYFLEMNKDRHDASTNEIFRFCYHNVKEFRDYKREFYREKYRQRLNNNVRQYIKYRKDDVTQSSNVLDAILCTTTR